MSFTDLYINVLAPFIQNFRDASNQKERKSVVKNAADAVVNSRLRMENKGADLPNDLEKVCLIFSFVPHSHSEIFITT
jgi:hypothetical protein